MITYLVLSSAFLRQQTVQGPQIQRWKRERAIEQYQEKNSGLAISAKKFTRICAVRMYRERRRDSGRQSHHPRMVCRQAVSGVQAYLAVNPSFIIFYCRSLSGENGHSLKVRQRRVRLLFFRKKELKQVARKCLSKKRKKKKAHAHLCLNLRQHLQQFSTQKMTQQ